MKHRFLMCVIFFFLFLSMTAEAEYPEWQFRMEFNQMLAVLVGAECRLGRYWGILGGMGIAPPNIAHFNVNLLGVFYIREEDRTFQIDLYAGVPVGYFNFFEGRCVDWASHIDSPYQGGLLGGGIRWSFRFRSWCLGLRTGVGAHLEWIGGEWQNVKPIPEFTLEIRIISKKNREPN